MTHLDGLPVPREVRDVVPPRHLARLGPAAAPLQLGPELALPRLPGRGHGEGAAAAAQLLRALHQETPRPHPAAALGLPGHPPAAAPKSQYCGHPGDVRADWPQLLPWLGECSLLILFTTQVPGLGKVADNYYINTPGEQLNLAYLPCDP